MIVSTGRRCVRSIARLKSSCVVHPVHVLVHQEHWLLGREALELIDQHLLRALLLAVRPQVEVRVPIMRRHAEQRRYERRSLIEPVGAARQQRLQLI